MDIVISTTINLALQMFVCSPTWRVLQIVTIWRKKQIAGWWKIYTIKSYLVSGKQLLRATEKNYNLFRNHKLNKLGETALHLAVSHGPENIVEDHVQIISQQGSIKEVLRITNNQGNNPLHLAAATGSLRKCICIAEAHPSLGNERNQMGESPLFLAALHGILVANPCQQAFWYWPLLDCLDIFVIHSNSCRYQVKAQENQTINHETRFLKIYIRLSQSGQNNP